MNAGSIVPLARTTWRELRNGVRHEPRQRAISLFALAVGGLLGLLGAVRLSRALRTWEGAGPARIDTALWLVCTAAWMAAGAMAWIGFRERGFGDRARLLFTLPVPRAGRARWLVGEGALQLAGAFGLSLLGALWALVHSLGFRSLPWIALLAAGLGVALWSVFLLQMSWIAAGRSRLVVLFALASLVAAGVGVWALGAMSRAGAGAATVASSPPSPWLGFALMLGLLVLCAGPGAGLSGRLYERAFFRLEAGTERTRPRRLLRLLTHPLRAWRGPTGALLVREGLLRGRQGLEWIRFALFALALVLLYPWLRPLLAAHGLAGPLGVVAMLVATALFYVLDGSSSPFGAEGSRLTLYLSAPIPLRTLLRAKVAVLFLPLWLGGLAGAMLLGRRGGLDWESIVWAQGAVSLLLLGLAALFALGSAWDADPELEIEPGLRGLVQETAPITTVRMALFLLASLLAAVEMALLLRIGTNWGALVGLAALDIALVALLTPLAEKALRRRASPHYG